MEKVDAMDIYTPTCGDSMDILPPLVGRGQGGRLMIPSYIGKSKGASPFAHQHKADEALGYFTCFIISEPGLGLPRRRLLGGLSVQSAARIICAFGSAEIFAFHYSLF